MAMDGLAELLSDCWTASGEVLEGLGEVLGVMLGPKMAAKSRSYPKKKKNKCCSKRQKVPKRFFDGFRVEDKQRWRPQNLYLSLGILMSSAYRRFQVDHGFFSILGAHMEPCWHQKSTKNFKNEVPEGVEKAFHFHGHFCALLVLSWVPT